MSNPLQNLENPQTVSINTNLTQTFEGHLPVHLIAETSQNIAVEKDLQLTRHVTPPLPPQFNESFIDTEPSSQPILVSPSLEVPTQSNVHNPQS